MELQQKIETNTWDHIDDVLRVLELARAGKWAWYGNSRCKYIEVRIDMRNGGCILRDREGKRIEVADFAEQAHAEQGIAWEPRPESKPPNEQGERQ